MKTKRNRGFINKTLRFTRGGIGKKELEQRRKKVREDQTKKDQFRNMIIHFLEKYKSNSKKAIEFIINGFKSNRPYINTLVPIVEKYNPINKQTYNGTSSQIEFIPAMSVIIAHISPSKNSENTDSTNEFLIKIIDSFIENTGNINLVSIKNNVCALSVAVEKENKTIAEYLLKTGNAYFDLLNESQLLKLNNMNIIEEKTPIEIIKLAIPTELPQENGYDSVREPEFWKPIFQEGELLGLKTMIQTMMMDDIYLDVHNIEENKTSKWSLCEINKAIIPTYYYPEKNELYESYGMFYKDTAFDFAAYNTILCGTLLVIGIISYKMIGQDYKILLKGGKAVQLALSGIPNIDVYESEDIDVIIIPKDGYDEDKIKNVAGHIGYLVKWFLELKDPVRLDNDISISLREPNIENNIYIYKLSLIKSQKKRIFNKNKNQYEVVNDYKQFSDIDIREISIEMKEILNETVDYVFNVPELFTKILLVCNNIGSILDEKIYYYIKYFEVKEKLLLREKIEDVKYKDVTILECDRYMSKFRRAILALVSGIQLGRKTKTMNMNKKEESILLPRIKKYVDNANKAIILSKKILDKS